MASQIIQVTGSGVLPVMYGERGEKWGVQAKWRYDYSTATPIFTDIMNLVEHLIS